MSETEQHEFGFAEPPNQRIRRRGVYILPGLFTVGNLLCGFYAILATLKGGTTDLDDAARAIGFAILFDAFDGFIARATGTNTEFGKQFDSLADMVSFGIAPAILAFSWGVQALLASRRSRGAPRLSARLAGEPGLRDLLRLASGSLQRSRHGPAGGLKYFVGMPTPAAAGMIAAVVHAFKFPLEDWRWSVPWLALVLALAFLMVSSVRYPSFKQIPWGKRQHSLMIVVGAILIWSIVVYSEIVLILIASGYLVAGFTLYLIRLVRHRLVSRPA